MVMLTGPNRSCSSSRSMSSKPFNVPSKNLVIAGLGGAIALLTLISTVSHQNSLFIFGLDDSSVLMLVTVLSGILGALLTGSINAADTPVVITLLNSYSGWALCAEGALLSNPLLISVGALIGFSGAILTSIMCQAMNRDVLGVILGSTNKNMAKKTLATTGNSNDSSDTGSSDTPTTLTYTQIIPSEAATILQGAKSVVIVPGYGLAVAKGQFVIANIASKLKKAGVNVKFGIHPVAGRMPGQLNILLAEAGVPFDMVCELDEINDDFPSTDVTVVVGASDTVNSDAENDMNCAIAGMPVLQVWKSKQVIALKRGMGATGYAGMTNPIFYNANTDMILGDAKDTLTEIEALL